MKNELSQFGYDKEGEYFFKVNKELIEKRRQSLDREKKIVNDREIKKEHWLKCPKCGHDMAERNLLGVFVDQCQSCQGIYFDWGEIELLMEAKEQGEFWGWLKKYFQDKSQSENLYHK